MPGWFISLDGIDGTGKSTQCALLTEWLTGRGFEVQSVVDPGGTPLGQRLREILLHGKGEMSARTEALLFMASRAELVAVEIAPALAAGKMVISDRYLLSTVVYQGYGAGLSCDELWQVGKLATGGVSPQFTYILDLPVPDAMLRRGRSPDRMESRAIDFHERVRQGFRIEADRDPTTIRLINAQASVDQIQMQIREDLTRRLQEAKT